MKCLKEDKRGFVSVLYDQNPLTTLALFGDNKHKFNSSVGQRTKILWEWADIYRYLVSNRSQYYVYTHSRFNQMLYIYI